MNSLDIKERVTEQTLISDFNSCAIWQMKNTKFEEYVFILFNTSIERAVKETDQRQRFNIQRATAI